MTDAYSFDGSRTTLGARTAVAIAAVATAVLGVSAGYALQTALGIVGGLAFGVAARDVSEDALRSRVRGSTLLVVASVFVVLALALQKRTFTDALLVATVPAAVGVTTVSALVDPDEVVGPVFAALSRSFVATLVGTFVAAALYANVVGSAIGGSWGVFAVLLGVTPMVGFVALQFEFLLVGVLATKAGRAAAELDPERSASDVDAMGVRDVPTSVWLLLGVQVLLVALPGGAALFDFVLALAGPVGVIAAVVLSSVYLHGALLVLAAVLATLPIAAFVRRSVVSVLGNRPPKSLAFATGGVALSTVVVVVTSIPGFEALVRWLAGEESVVTGVVDAYGVGPSVLAGVSGVLVVVGGCLFFYVAAFGLPFVPEHASGFVFGGASLFVAGVAGAFAGAPAPAVFVAMAASLAVWDVGEYSVTLGTELGRAASTQTIEAVHVLATLAVGALAVVVASLATHFFVPLMTGVSEGRALTALGLLSVALVAFACLARTGSTDA
ncbi:hypothetical protein G9C85_15815 [Halorubellus sp. JP-L1]|uniref:DUF7519 family protein n=1 Tax=Halorubellus sp. JP-L1 TaxID=2715753 RepID=UPI00140B40ED|nr:hypothetical protein [Halorubellus sp. JP-L1]NHN43084.1 hypothetical protein [Halorubellus sp. JP-L1]